MPLALEGFFYDSLLSSNHSRMLLRIIVGDFMNPKTMLLGLVVGIAMFISDLKIGWLSTLLGGFPSILVIAFVSGVISGDIGGGTLSGLGSGVGGIATSIVLSPYLFPEWGTPPPDIFDQVLWALGSSIAASGYAVVEGLAAALGVLGVILSVLISIILLGLSFVSGLFGGILGRILHHFLLPKK